MMTQFQNGQVVEGVILSLTDDALRVALRGSADTAVFTKVNGAWVSEDCEPITLWLGNGVPAPPRAMDESDFICSAELAARLVKLLLDGDNGTPLPAYSDEPHAAGEFVSAEPAS